MVKRQGVLLKVGDIVIDPKGQQWRIAERRGTDALYSVKIEPTDWKLPFGKKYYWLLTADWYMTHGWTRV